MGFCMSIFKKLLKALLAFSFFLVLSCPSGASSSAESANVLKLVLSKDNPTYLDVRRHTGENPYTLKVSILPSNATNKRLKWSTNDQSTITINEQTGEIVPIREGSATVRCTSVSNPKVYEECTLTVITPIDSLEIEQKDLMVSLNSETSLNLILTPENPTYTSIEWTSNAPDVASVSSLGVVSAKRTGTATISARAYDGRWAFVNVVVKP